MAAYLILEMNYKTQEWVADYRANVPSIVGRCGGKYLARTLEAEVLEGENPASDVVGIVEFASIESAKAFLEDPQYQPYRLARQAGATTRITAIAS